ncbi:MAG: autotransporter outer membrane beta-barrel domain-containing protein [Treponema sp.]|jgi:hypothetical protein|nr:autotransporter outer membrane beta-barrel domain-containing protein [Treponema sp.]
MAKKIVLGLLVLAAITGFLGAREADAPAEAANAPARAAAEPAESKWAVSLDLFPLTKGIIWSDSDKDNALFALAPAFEFAVYPHFTIGAALDMYFGEYSKVDIFYFGLAAHGRWYPLSNGLDKLFIDAGLGFNVFALDGETDADKGGMSGITMSLKAGYKLKFTPNFFLEPSMAYIYAKLPGGGIPTPLGWQPGLNIGVAF